MDTTITVAEIARSSAAAVVPIARDELPVPPAPAASTWLRRLAAPLMALVDFWRDVTSPGLHDVTLVSPLALRDGGQLRYHRP